MTHLVCTDPRVVALELPAEIPEAAGEDEVAAPAGHHETKYQFDMQKQRGMFDFVSKRDANRGSKCGIVTK